MEELTRRVRHVLGVYLERGGQALALLRERKYDEAQAVLRARNAAFHNFKAIDAQALAGGLDVAKDEVVLSLWAEIRKIDVQLAAELAQAKSATQTLAGKLREARRKISGYRSGSPEETRFTRTA